ncbi:cytochrome b-c1 complex subunit 9 [Leptopilina boulardi]|uniref:cytochrome b-c1 complex subunit 9 n=1 Tax=Leptopilina boulardi TaxID=63433 RepID=UPI0021F60ED1|nr:cytochrome b-c1 complex subunit 9 [Leptopilina boulardi]XP_051164089.1 cytochrome b-c1 complex subunit 9 [Leptopilina boulardi]
MSAVNFIYKAVFKRTSTFVFSIVVASFLFERTIDATTDAIFESRNRGKLWKDIKHKYE